MNPKQLVPNLKVIIFELVAGMLNFLFACLASVSHWDNVQHPKNLFYVSVARSLG